MSGSPDVEPTESTTRQRSWSRPPLHTHGHGNTEVYEHLHQHEQQRQTTDVPNSDTVACGLGRRTVGICLLLIVVILWTASNFLASVCR